jgi:hypothetical protein
MRKLILAVAILAAFSIGTLKAVSFTMEFTADQVATAQWKYASLGGASGTGFATIQLWFANEVRSMLEEWATQKKLADYSAFCAAFSTASNTAKNTVCTNLGLPATWGTATPGCNPCQ